MGPAGVDCVVFDVGVDGEFVWVRFGGKSFWHESKLQVGFDISL